MKNALLSCSFAVAISVAAPFAAVAQEADEPIISFHTIARDITGSVPNAANRYLRIAPTDGAPDGIMTPVFKRIANDPWQLRFDGEVGVNDLPIFLKPDQLRENSRLRLRYISSVSVMPEASRMLVHINDQQVAEIMLDSAAQTGIAEIPIPAGLLQPGYNAVRLSVQQRHRVDCSIEAANELWTQVDAAGSGLMLITANDPINSVDDLRGFPENEDGSVPVTIVIPPGGDLAQIDQALRAAQALAIRADIRKPQITIAREAATRSGIQLFIGLRSSLPTEVSGQLDDTGVQVQGRGASYANVVITGEKPADIEAAIHRLTNEAHRGEEQGTPAGLRAVVFQRGARVSSETEIDLAAFGISTQEFGGRVFKTSFNVIMPADFYPADNGKATLFLDAEYPAGLLTTNEALVRINGKVTGASRLTRSTGETISRRAIEMSLRSLTPGYNRITLEIRAATEGDKDCDPLSLIGGSRRLTVLSSTSFALPRFARANHLPNLGALSAHGYPLANLPAPVQLVIPRPDPATLSAAATLLARMAIALGQPVNVRTMMRAPDETSGAAIIVSPIADVPDWMLQHFEMPPEFLPRSWQDVRNRKAAIKPGNDSLAKIASPIIPASPLPSPLAPPQANPPAAPQAALRPAQPDAGKPAAAKEQRLEEKAAKSLSDRFLEGTSNFLQRNVGFSPEQLSFLHAPTAVSGISQATTVMLAQASAKSRSSEPWILLTGISAEALQRDSMELISPAQWQNTQGQLVAFDPESRALLRVPTSHESYVQMSEHSMKNVTLFAAGWLSNHIHYYVLVMIGVCLVFGIFSRKLLNHVGQKP